MPGQEHPGAGWYIEPVTGQHVYYDSFDRKFYTMGGGVYIPLGYMNPAPKQVSVAPGDTAQDKHILQVYRAGYKRGDWLLQHRG